ncbi:hypothetical protein ABZ208_13780 [Streptomyces sp. NPDC006208]|uniref:hypothetical protein n=1 Tax=Streptomyces sp. NPDC006208 TaxID=3156734 RepID=UPI0033A42AD6
MASYREIQSAVRVEKFKIWLAWLCGGILMLIIAKGTEDIRIVSVITQVLLVVLGILSTIAAVSMTNRLNRKADAARRDVLGDV